MSTNSKTPIYLNQGAPEALKFYPGNRKQEENHYEDIGNFNQDNLNTPYFDFPLTAPNWEEEAFLREFNKQLWEEDQKYSITKAEEEEFRTSNAIELTGENISSPILNINKFKAPKFIVDNFKKEFESLTPVQSECWPIMMYGRDLIAQSPTGTGKTMAYLLPTILHVINQPKLPYGHGPLALILAPSRELADQINHLVFKLIQDISRPYRKIRILTLMGGTPKKSQINALEKGVDLLVASPGRLYDMLISSATHLKHTRLIVLDEADKLMFGMHKELNIILSQLHPNSQKALFSATASVPHLKKVTKTMDNPIQICIGESAPLLATQSVKQSFELVTEGGKLDNLLTKFKSFVPRVDGKYERAIVFCRNRQAVEETSAHLLHSGLNPIAFHSDLSQNERKWVLQQFRTKEYSLLVTSHLVGRGIDFQHINYILIKDPPNSLREHAHMIGRTGRNNTRGYCHTFLTIGDQNLILRLAKAMKGKVIDEDPVLLDIAKRYEAIEDNRNKQKTTKKRRKNEHFEEFDAPMFQRMN